MSTEKTKVVLAAPAIIPPTYLSYHIANEIAKIMNLDDFELIMLHGPAATRGNFLLAMESQPDAIMYLGHGDKSSLCGEDLWCSMCTINDVRYLENKIICALPACECGAQLAPAAIEAGARCFMAATEKMYGAFPEEERDYNSDWQDYILELYRVLLRGGTTGEALQAYYNKATSYMNLYYAHIGDWESADFYYMSTKKNIDYFKLFGDPNVRLSPTLETRAGTDLLTAIGNILRSWFP